MQTLPQVGMGCPAPHPGFRRVPLELLGSEVLGRAWVQKGGPECSIHMYRTAPAPSLMVGTRYAPEQKQ